MPSRMERYYEASEDGPSRTKRNQELYNQILDENNFEDEKITTKDYSNISGIAKTPDSSTVNIDKIREMINSREENNRHREMPIIEPEEEKEEEKEEEPKNYDINDVLNKAKDEREPEENSEYHSLKNVELNILKNLNIGDKKEEKEEEKEVLSDDPNELPELINTITNTSMLNKLGDKELSLDLLGDLKSNGTTMIGTSDAIKNVLEESKKKEVKDETTEIDKSFFTKSLDLKDSLKYLDGDEEDEDSKSIKAIVIIIAIVALLVVGVALYLVFKK